MLWDEMGEVESSWQESNQQSRSEWKSTRVWLLANAGFSLFPPCLSGHILSNSVMLFLLQVFGEAETMSEDSSSSSDEGT